MPIITKDPHQWVIVTNSAGQKLTVFNDETKDHNFRFGFQVNFSDNPTPSSNTVTFYNLSKAHRSFFKKKEKVRLYFNWGKNKKLLCEGFITKVGVNQTDGVTDTFIITFTEGTDYSNIAARKMKISKKKKVHKTKKVKVKEKDKYKTKLSHYYVTETYKSGKKKGQKHKVRKVKRSKVLVKGKTKTKRVRYRAYKTVYVNKTYHKGTSYKTLIKGIADQAGLKIAKLQLHKNPKKKKAYTASGKPLTLIEQLVKKTGSKMTYIKGKLVIVDPKKVKRAGIKIDDNDLITPPTYNEADNGSDGTWEITTPLIPDLQINDRIIMSSRFLKGHFYVKAGVHSNDGENPQTQCSLAKL